jgi:hypothetical protein
MRPCDRCGYLLPEAWDACKKCGAPKAASRQAAPVGAGVAARAGAPAGVAAPAPGAPARHAPDLAYAAPVRIGFGSPNEAPPGTAFQPPPTAGAQWTSPSAPPKGSSVGRALGSLVLVAAIVAGGVVGWQALTSEDVPAAIKTYVDGGGVDYAPPGTGYRVRLPAAPVEEHASQQIGAMSLTTRAALVQTDSYEVAVAVVDLGFEVDMRGADPLLAGALAGGFEGAGGEISGKSDTEHDGRPALDGRGTGPDGHPVRLRLILDGSRMYTLFAHAPAGTNALFDELVDSFVLSPGGVRAS